MARAGWELPLPARLAATGVWRARQREPPGFNLRSLLLAWEEETMFDVRNFFLRRASSFQNDLLLWFAARI